MPELDDVFDIYDGVINSLFADLDLPTLAPGRAWDTTDLYVGGSLRVTPAPVPLPASVWVLFSALLVLRRRRA